MNSTISNVICPLLLLYILVATIQYIGADYTHRSIIVFVNVLNFLFCLMFIVFGLGAVLIGISRTTVFFNSQWSNLSEFSKKYYENDLTILQRTYMIKMAVTGICFIAMGILIIIAIVFDFLFLKRLDNTWRPPVTSRFLDKRAKRYIKVKY